MKMKPATYILASALLLMPVSATADVVELSQNQLRALVTQKQVLSAETVVTGTAMRFGGDVMDVRGFLSDGKMTYRLLMQRGDGSIVEVLIDGQNGQQISHNSAMGQTVSTVARVLKRTTTNTSSNSGSENASSNSNRNSSASNNIRSNGNSGNSNRGSGNNNRGGNGNGNGKRS